MKKQILLSLVLLISCPNIVASENRKSPHPSWIAKALVFPMLLTLVAPGSAQSSPDFSFLDDFLDDMKKGEAKVWSTEKIKKPECKPDERDVPLAIGCSPCDAGGRHGSVSLYQNPSSLLVGYRLGRHQWSRVYKNKYDTKEMSNSSNPEYRMIACALEIFSRTDLFEKTYYDDETCEWARSGYYGYYPNKKKGCASQICPIIAKTITRPGKNCGKKKQFSKGKHSYKKNFQKNRGGRKR